MSEGHDRTFYESFGGPVLEQVVVTPATADLNVGATQQMTATGRYSGGRSIDVGGSVTWSSTDASVATVNAAGLVSVVGVGVVSIVATLGFVSGSAIIVVSTGNAYFWFRHTVASLSSDFTVTLPSSLLTDAYAVKLVQSKGSAVVVLSAPDDLAGDRTLSQFRVVASAPLAAGDKIDVLVLV